MNMRHGKRMRLALAVLALCAAGLGNVTEVWAGAYAAGDSATAAGNNATAVGNTATASGATGTAIGNNARATGSWTTALGTNALASGSGGTAIGDCAEAAGDNWSFALGGYAKAYTDSSIAIGRQATVGTSGTKTSGGVAGIAIGTNAKVNSVAYAGASVTGDLAIAFGTASAASASFATALGVSSLASGTSSISLGDSTASGNYSFAAGLNATASNTSAIAIGGYSTADKGAQATNDNTIAIGSFSTASGGRDIAIGMNAVASGGNSVAIGGSNASTTGDGAYASGQHTVSVGFESKAYGAGSLSLGANATTGTSGTTAVTILNATAVGYYAEATTIGSTAIGGYADAKTGQYATALGYYANATGSRAIAIGAASMAAQAPTASKDYAIAVGSNTVASGTNSIAIGGNTSSGSGAAASNTSAIALGNVSKAQGLYSMAVGDTAAANANYSTAIGYKATVGTSGTLDSGGAGGIAIGSYGTASGNAAIFAGPSVTGNYAIAIGGGTSAANTYAVAMGTTAKATGFASVAFGYGATASEKGTIAIGGYNGGESVAPSASGVYGISIGSSTAASGNSSIAIGLSAKAVGNFTTAVGRYSEAGLLEAAAFGDAARAYAKNSLAMGYLATVGTKTSTTVDNVTTTTYGDAGIGGIAIGNYYDASNAGPTVLANYGIAIGTNAKVNTGATYSTAVGYGATTAANAMYSAAMGYGAMASGTSSQSFGRATRAYTNYSYAAGSFAVVGENTSTGSNGQYGIAIGNGDSAYSATSGIKSAGVLANYGIAIGTSTMVNTGANYSTAVGYGATTEANATFATALGYSSSAVGTNSISLGDSVAGTSSNGYAFAAGTNASATGTNSIAIGGNNTSGYGAAASNTAAIAIGSASKAAGMDSVAIGAAPAANTNYSTAIGYRATVGTSGTLDSGGVGGVAIGNYVGTNMVAPVVAADYSIAIGTNAKVNSGATYSTAVGYKAVVAENATYASAIGYFTDAGGSYAAALGTTAHAYTESSIAMGRGAIVGVSGTPGSGGVAGIAIGGTTSTSGGNPAKVFANFGIAMGTSASVSDSAATKAVAVGYGASVSKASGVALGDTASVTGEKATALGYSSSAVGANSISIGDSQATAANTTAVGDQSQATVAGASAFGYHAKAQGEDSVAIGRTAVATKSASGAFGKFTSSEGEASGAYGAYSTASGDYSGAYGAEATAAGDYSGAYGYYATANLERSLAIGAYATAGAGEDDLLGSGIGSVAIGNYDGSDETTGPTVLADYGIAIGTKTKVNSGATNAIAFGYGATVGAENGSEDAVAAIAIGSGVYDEGSSEYTENPATVYGNYSIALGTAAAVGTEDDSAEKSVALGYSANAAGISSIALGDSTAGTSSNGYAFSAGTNASATGANSIAIGGNDTEGKGAQATAADAIAIGSNASASGKEATAVGYNATTNQASGVALGDSAAVTHTNSVAIGANSATKEADSVSVGYEAPTNSNALTSTMTRTITNVTQGDSEHDAATWDQITKTSQTLTLKSDDVSYTYTTTDDETKTVYKNQIGTNDGTALATFTKMSSVSDTDYGFVSGHDLYEETRKNLGSNQNYISAQDAGANLLALDTAIGKVTSTGEGDLHYITAQNGTSVNVAYNLKELDDALYEHSKLVKTDNATATSATKILVGSDTDFDNVTEVSVFKADGSTTRKITGVTAGSANTDAANYGQIAAKDQTFTLNSTNKVAEIKANDSSISLAKITIATGAITSSDTGFVDGKTVYNYDKPVAKTNYTLTNVSDTASTGVNLGTLDAAIVDQQKLIKANTAKTEIQIGNDSEYANATTVNVGGTATTRKITGVTAGSATTDAVNYGQIAATGQTFNVKVGESADIKNNNNVSLANITFTGMQSVSGDDTGFVSGANLYNEVRVTGSKGTDYNYIDSTYTTAQNLIALDTAIKTSALIVGDTKTHWLDVSWNDTANDGNRGKSSSAYGYLANAKGDYSLALGANAKAEAQTAIAIGGNQYGEGSDYQKNAAYAKDSGTIAIGINTYAGSYLSEAPNAIAIGSNSLAYGTNSVAIGGSSESGKGAYATGSGAVALGSTAEASGENALAIGVGATAGANAVAIGQGSVADTAGTVSVGASTSSTRTIVNVTAGDSTKDAANWDQIIAKGQNLTLGTTAQSIASNNDGDYVTLTVDGSGVIASGNTNLITGGTAYSYLSPAVLTSGSYNYIASGGTNGKTTAENLVALDTAIGKVTGTKGSDIYYIDPQGDSVSVATNLKQLDSALYEYAKIIKTDDAENPTKILVGNDDKFANVEEVSVAKKDNTARTISGVAKATANGQAANYEQIAKTAQTVTLETTAEPAEGATENRTNLIKANDGTVLAAFTKMASVATDDYGFVSGADLYDETRKNVSGTYISSSNDAGTNLSNLDTKIGTIDDTKTTTVKQENTIAKNLMLLDESQTGLISLENLAEGTGKQIHVGGGKTDDIKGVTNITVANSEGTARTISGVAKATANGQAVNYEQIAKTAQTVTLETTAEPAEGATENRTNLIKANDGTVLAAFTKMASVAMDDYGFVSGADLYTENRANVSGNYIAQTSDAGTNLSALDAAIGVTSKGHYISAQKTTPQGATSVTNVATNLTELDNALYEYAKIVRVGKDDDAGKILVGRDDDETASAFANVTTIDVSNGGTNYRTIAGVKYDSVDNHNAAAYGQLVKAGTYSATSGSDTTQVQTATLAYNDENSNASKIQISIAGEGAVAANDARLVNGGTMYTELRPTTGNYISDQATAANLSALDAAIGAVTTKGTYIKVSKTNTSTATETATVSENLALLDKAIASNQYVGSDTVSIEKAEGAADTDPYKVSVKYMAASELHEKVDPSDENSADKILETVATGRDAIAIGNGAQSTGFYTVTYGSEAKADDYAGIAIGMLAQATGGDHAMAIGSAATAKGNIATAIGSSAKAEGYNASAFGAGAEGTAQGATAIGGDTEASEFAATALGYTAYAKGNSATAIGAGSIVSALQATGLGAYTRTQGVASLALGAQSMTGEDATFATAIGYASHALAADATTLGHHSYAADTATGSTAIGAGSVVKTAVATEGGNQVATVSFGHQNGNTYMTVDENGDHVEATYSDVLLSRLTNVAYGKSQYDAAAWGQIAKEDQTIELSTAARSETDTSKKNILVSNDGTVLATFNTAEITSGNTGFVSGGDLFDEVRVTGDNYNYISKNNTAAQNLEALDEALEAATLIVGDDAGESPTHWLDVKWNNEANAGKRGVNSSAYGYTASAQGEASAAYGYGAKAEGTGSVSIGKASAGTSANYYATAIGMNATATGESSVAIGGANTVTNAAGVTTTGASALGGFSVAIGNDAKSESTGAIALGSGASASTLNAVAIGLHAKAITGDNTTAVGVSAYASGAAASAFGSNAKAYTENSVALGKSARVGTSSTSAGASGVAIGESAQTTVDYGVSLGANTSVTGANSVALGAGSVASEAYSVSVGSSSQTRTITNVTAGNSTKDAANWDQIIAKGQNLTLGTTAQSIVSNNDGDYVTLTVDGSGVIASGNTNLITGGTAYTYLSPAVLTSGSYNYIASGGTNGKTTAENLVALDTAIGKTVQGHYITAQNGTSVNVAYNLKELDDALYEHSKLVKTNKTATADATKILIGSDADFDTVTDISVAKAGGAERTISGVAYGTDSHNAAAVGQLIAGGNYSATSGNVATKAQTATLNYIDNKNTAQKVSITIAGEGKVEDGDERLLKGDTVYHALEDAITQNTYKGSDTVSIAKEDNQSYYTVRVRNMAMSETYAVTTAPTATGTNALALGAGGTATGDYAQAIGTNAKATGNWSIAIGLGAEATWTALAPDSSGNTGATIAIGLNAKTSGNGSSAIGAEASATGEDAVAFGSEASAAGYESVAVGSSASAGNVSATALGSMTNASGVASSAFGYYSQATGDASTAMGYGSGALGTGTTAIGAGAKAYNGADYSMAIGVNAEAQIGNAVAIGKDAVASEANTVSFGHKSTDTHATASGAVAYGTNSFARLTNVAYGIDNNDAAAWGQIAQAGQTVTLGATGNKTIQANDGSTLVTFDVTEGVIEANNTGFVTGGTAYTYLNPTTGNYVTSGATTAANLNALDAAIGKVTSTGTGDLHYITEQNGTTVNVATNLKELDDALYEHQKIVRVNTNKDTILIGKDDGSDTDFADVKTIDVSNGNTTRKITGVTKGNSTNDAAIWDQIAKENQTIELSTAARTDSSAKNTLVANDGTVLATFNTAEIASGNTGFVSGGNLFSEVRVTGSKDVDYSYIDKGNTTAENLEALDAALSDNHYKGSDTVSVAKENNEKEYTIRVKNMAQSTSANKVSNGTTSAAGENAISFGAGSIVSGDNAMALGNANSVNGTKSIVAGYGNSLTGIDSVIVGSGNEATQSTSVTVGYRNYNYGYGSTVVGKDNYTLGENSAAIGYSNVATGKNTSAVGNQNYAKGENASAFGWGDGAYGKNSSAMGYSNDVYGENSATFGYTNKVGEAEYDDDGRLVIDATKGNNTYVFGANNTVTANNALILGTGVAGTVGDGAIVLGTNITGNVAANSVVIGAGSTSEDENTVSVGTTSGERKIVHVANGAVNTDAATYGQILKAGDYSATSSNDASKVQTATLASNDGTLNYTIAIAGEGEVAGNDVRLVNGDTVYKATVKTGQTVNLGSTTTTVNGKTINANQIVSNDGTVLATFERMVEVKNGDIGFVSGTDLYNEVRPGEGNWISNQATKTNLTALDAAIGKVTSTGTGDLHYITEQNGTSVNVATNLKELDDAIYEHQKIVRVNGDKTKILIGQDEGNDTDFANVTTIDVSNGTTYRTISGMAAGKAAHEAVEFSQIQTVAKTDQQNGTYLTSTLKNGELDEKGTVGANLAALDAKAVSTKTGTNVINLSSTGNKLISNDGTTLATFTAGSITVSDENFISGKTVYEYSKPVAKAGSTLKNVVETASTGVNLGLLDAAIADQQKLITYDSTGNGKISIGAGEGITADTVSFYANDGQTTRVLSGITYGTANNDAAAVGQLIAGGNYSATSGTDATKAQTATLNYIDNNNTATKVSITIAGEGKVEDGDQRLLNGDTVYHALKDAITLNTYQGSDTVSIVKEDNQSYYTVRVKKMAQSTAEDEEEENGTTKAKGIDAVAFGTGAQALANYALAFGMRANAGTAGAVALGQGATVSGANSVALGSGSVATADNVVSVGSGATTNGTRKIVNVTAGSANTDAATYGQIAKSGQTFTLNSANNVANIVANDGTTSLAKITITKGSVTSGDTGFVDGGTVFTAIQDAKTAATQSVATLKTEITSKITSDKGNYIQAGDAVGTNLKALDDAIGVVKAEGDQKLYVIEESLDGNGNLQASVSKNLMKIDYKIGSIATTDSDGQAITYTAINADKSISDNLVALDKVISSGVTADLDHIKNVTKEEKAEANEDGAIALGDGSKGSAKDSISFGTNAEASKENAVSIGTSAKASATSALAFGNSAAASSDNALAFGNSAAASADSAIAIGNGASAKGQGSVAIGSGSVATEANVVSVGSEGNERKITNVAAGVNDTDAVNVSQLKQSFASIQNTLTDDINRVGAGAAALAALRPEAFDPSDKVSFAVGFGHYRNANATAIGAFFKPNADTTISLGGTIGNGDPLMNAGISFKLGGRSKGPGIYSSNTELVREVNALRADNKALKNDNAAQAKKIDQQAQKIDQQAQKIDAQTKRIESLESDNTEMKKQIQMILARMDMSSSVQKSAAR